jgi:hypothetical protein
MKSLNVNCSLLILLVLIALIHPDRVQSDNKTDNSVTISKSSEKNEENSCQAENCKLLQKLEQWFGLLSDHIIECGADDDNAGSKSDQKIGVPMIQIVSCDQEGALWNYKYAGNKGKKRIFKGKGKISFVRSESPPHGYDSTLLYATLRYSTLRYSTLIYATLRYSTLLYATLR